MAGWLRQPHVEAWFPWEHGDADPVEAVAAEYGPGIDGTDHDRVLHRRGERSRRRLRAALPVQCRSRVDVDPGRRARQPGAVDRSTQTAIGIDYAIGELTAVGRGVGTAAISLFVADTFATYNEIDWIVVSMQQANRYSWRALERVGFNRRWAGLLDSPDPSDAGPTFVYVRHRDW